MFDCRLVFIRSINCWVVSCSARIQSSRSDAGFNMTDGAEMLSSDICHILDAVRVPALSVCRGIFLSSLDRLVTVGPAVLLRSPTLWSKNGSRSYTLSSHHLVTNQIVSSMSKQVLELESSASISQGLTDVW